MVAETLFLSQDPDGAATPPIPTGSLCLSAPSPQPRPKATQDPLAAAAAAVQQTPPTGPAAAMLTRVVGQSREGGKKDKRDGSVEDPVLDFATGRTDVSALAQPDKRSANRRSCRLCLGPTQSVWIAGQKLDSVVISACPLLFSSYRKVMGHKRRALDRERLGANLEFCHLSSVS